MMNITKDIETFETYFRPYIGDHEEMEYVLTGIRGGVWGLRSVKGFFEMCDRYYHEGFRTIYIVLCKPKANGLFAIIWRVK